ncbi:hypothetical protein Bhyg_01212 [Pseudolycoriella hygida]|uniref:WAP domain-containing protein n=1 Tax=Pseudolycoriella hygida TaxID=35572 RepID=A0A9Q0N9E7_9DIPT|nr:hypothetical protein Bhyg_01212 [Pseudolycoriella hygida]
MAKLALIVGVCLALTAVVHAGINGDCPLSSQHSICTPKCIQDSDCSSIGGKCCPNLCNQKSCVRPQVGSNSGGSGYKGTSNLTLIVGVCFVLTAVVYAGINADCPPSSQHTICKPTCIDDYECSKIGGKCCRNLCNTKSCVRLQFGSKTGGSGYKGSYGGAGIYCGNVKCKPGEKCEMDRTTKRLKCVRA